MSDVDNTLLGDDAALEQFSSWHAEAKDHVWVAYSSGRFCESILESVEDSLLPLPNAVIGGVGTEIRLLVDREKGRQGDKEAMWSRSSACLDRLTGWPIVDSRWDPDAIRALLAAHKELEPQPDHLQSDYKISYYGHGLDKTFVAQLRQELSAQGFDASVVYSSRRDLDVLPGDTNKGAAAAHLASHWGIDAGRVFVAGDSGNDLEMYRQDFRGIVVGNAQPELKGLTGANVYHAKRSYAAGVLEGLQHWLQSAFPKPGLAR